MTTDQNNKLDAIYNALGRIEVIDDIVYLGGGMGSGSYTFTFKEDYDRVLTIDYESSQTNGNEYRYSDTIEEEPTNLCTLAVRGSRGGYVRLFKNVKSGNSITVRGYNSDNSCSIYAFALN